MHYNEVINDINNSLEYSIESDGKLDRFDYLIEEIIFLITRTKDSKEFANFLDKVSSKLVNWAKLNTDNEISKFSEIYLSSFSKPEEKIKKIREIFDGILQYKRELNHEYNIDLEFLRGLDLEQVKKFLTKLPNLGEQNIKTILCYYFDSGMIIDQDIEIILKRLGIIPRELERITEIRDHMKKNVSLLFDNEIFYKLKIHFKKICTKLNPYCNLCKIYDLCNYKKKEEFMWIFEDLGKNDLKVIELFSGAGGIIEGFVSAGFKPLLAIDLFEPACKTLKENHSKTLVLCENIKYVEEKFVESLLKGKKPDIIVGGPPCQGFSIAGRQDPNDPRNSLFMEFVRFLGYFKPPYFLMENVPGLLSAKNAKGESVINIIVNEFENIGYDVKKPVKLNAADYGVPQARERIFIAGTNIKKDFVFPPKQTHSANLIRNSVDLDKWFNSGKQIQKLRGWTPVKEVLEPKEKIPANYFHTEKMIEGFKNRKARNIALGKGFGWQILDLNKPSYTISARYWKDGADALVKYNEEEIRMLTELECARIQTFPDNYKFLGNKREIYTQIGNAVPCLLAEKLAVSFKKALQAK